MRTEKKISYFPLVIIGLFLLITFSCAKNSEQMSPLPISDLTGNIYTEIPIGNQVWMMQNLNTTRYRNGDSIPTITDNTEWTTLNSGAQCNYMNIPAANSYYGRLYNWYAVNDPRNIAPSGWHIAQHLDYLVLETYMAKNPDASNSSAKILAAQIDWVPSTVDYAVGNNLYMNDNSGFSAVPVGIRSGLDGSFSSFGLNGTWWTSTEFDPNTAWTRAINYNKSTIDRNKFNKTYGFSVRCVKD